MKTAESYADKFEEFITKKKFVEENYYPGIADEKMRPMLTEKVNSIAVDFRSVSESGHPTDKKYQEKIGIGLSRFDNVYLQLDTEDRESMYIH
ncbi:DUF4844 domain-containing protein [Fulvivirga ligni]|nr:DUF4844 domain-containing protein [Fulvivirga ligni]UII19104.1 DUF4844 domain-containing protein [Fulvivirga ligni]